MCVRCAGVRVCVRVSVRVRVFARIRVRACAFEGIEDALPLGVLPPQEKASLLICLSPLGALSGGQGGHSRPVPVHA
jgi:hypothetical protein